jgi:hypothetical protein
MKNASTVIVTNVNAARPRYVCRQPTLATKCWTIGGQIAPAT